MFRYLRLIFPLVVFLCASAAADQADSSKTRQQGIHLKRLAYVGVAAAGVHWVGYRYFERTWWQGQNTGRFRVVYDWSGDTLLNMDQSGHFMAGILFAQTARDLYYWIGFSPRTAMLLGSLSSIAELLYIEFRDGRFDQWGFSIPDATADVLGALIPLIHAYIPASQAVRFKFSYFSSALYRDRKARQASGRPFVPSIIDDYEGMTFWMVLNPKPLLRGQAAEVWPNWLGVAVGVGAQGLHGFNHKSRGADRGYPKLPEAQREILLSLDFDFAHFLRDCEAFRKFMPYLRLSRFPTPALRIYPTRTFYLLYFG